MTADAPMLEVLVLTVVVVVICLLAFAGRREG